MSEQQSRDLIDRSPPYDFEAEKGVVGSIMLGGATVGFEVMPLVKAEDFYDSANGMIYAAICSLLEQSRPIDVELLLDRMKSRGTFEAAGGISYLYDVGQSVPNAAHAKYYAGIVSKCALRRRAIQAAVDMLAGLYNDGDEHLGSGPKESEIASHVEKLVGDALQLRSVEARQSAELFPHVGQQIRDRLSGKVQTSKAVSSGLKSFDNLVGGLFPQELMILAARPSMGKTALTTQIAAHLSITSTPTIYVSLEMSAEELAERQICSWAGINLHKVKTGKANAADNWLVEEISNDLARGNLSIIDQADVTAGEIIAAARQLRRKSVGPICLMVDYIGLVSFRERYGKRNELIGDFVKRMKWLAREIVSPVILISQLNRATESDKDKRPRLSNLRESGAIEEHADSVVMLHRPEYYEPKNPDVKGQAELIVAKNRNGPVGTADLKWNKRTLTFSDPDEEGGSVDDAQDAWDEAQNKQEELPF